MELCKHFFGDLFILILKYKKSYFGALSFHCVRGVGRAGSQESFVSCFTLYFCKKLFLRFESVASRSHDVLNSRYTRGPGKGQIIRVYCTRLYLAFL